MASERGALKGRWGTFHNHSDMNGVSWEGIQAPMLPLVSAPPRNLVFI